MTKGVLIVAQNNSNTDYIQCAKLLAKSIKLTNPTLSIALLTDKKIIDKNFDTIIEFPHGDCDKTDWKLANDWQIYDATPYDETLKIESDVLVTRNLDNWFEACSNRELAIAHGCVDYKNAPSQSRFYRHLFDKNELPDVYNGIVYFKKTDFTKEFFSLVRNIFENWDNYKKSLRYCADSEIATTDIVYAIAVSIFGEERCLIPSSVNPLKWVHMKPRIINTFGEDWTKECFFEILKCGQIRINSHSIFYPLHYVHKPLATKFWKYYG